MPPTFARRSVPAAITAVLGSVVKAAPSFFQTCRVAGARDWPATAFHPFTEQITMSSRFPMTTLAVVASSLALATFAIPTATATETSVPPPQMAEFGPDALTRGPSAVVVGNPEGDVTVVEFFDYQCPVCRRVHPFVEQLVAEDKNVRVIHKHWPVFGGASIYAAKLALAARWQGRYAFVHHAFMTIPGRLDEEKIRQAAIAAGLDVAQAERDLKERDAQVDMALREASAQAAMLQLQGTPGFVIGSFLVPGGLDLKTMKEIVADVRAKARSGKQG